VIQKERVTHMKENVPESSDSARSAKPLAHARSVTFKEPLHLQHGGTLENVTVCYETYGNLDHDYDNAVLICHALSGDSHVARHDEQDDTGWWDIVVGPKKPIDTEKLFVICPNVLGGCRGTTSPNTINPLTCRRYGSEFPTITIGDIVEVQKRLVDYLGIRKLRAVVGGSLGGQQVLCWAHRYPGYSSGYVPIATASRLPSQSLAFDIVGRNAILHDPHYHRGRYYGKKKRPDKGLAIARMIGHITYLSRESMEIKFNADRHHPQDIPTDFEKRFSVGSYLGYQGDRFVERFDANSYLTLSLAMDLFDLGSSPEVIAQNIGKADSRWLILSFTSDWLFPPDESWLLVKSLVSAGRRVSYCNVRSAHGHDSFLLSHNLDVYGELIRAFLSHLDDTPSGGVEHRKKVLGKEPEVRVSGEIQGMHISEEMSGIKPSGQKPDARVSGESPAIQPSGEEPDAQVCRKGKVSLSRNKNSFYGDPVSIFQQDRLDYERIVDLIPQGSSVLDLGCGHGELLCRLKMLGFTRLTGVELDEHAIISCARLGLDILYADLNEHLSPFTDRSYDYVVLSRTLQTILNIEGLLMEIVRIGERAIVSFPNFAYYKLREMLARQGRSPESNGILRYKWYDTPNIRFFSIDDFEDFCTELDIHVHKKIAIDTEAGTEIFEDQNRNADLAIFVLSR
jgi:homoserine O-acetyltransferase/methionine biosynthesis protein MetW